MVGLIAGIANLDKAWRRAEKCISTTEMKHNKKDESVRTAVEDAGEGHGYSERHHSVQCMYA